MDENIMNVLILCTGNSARSIMAEGLINVLGAGRLRAHSAGSSPTGRVNPYAVEQLAAIGYDCDQLRSKSWNEFTQPSAPHMDLVITVCDNAAGELCPLWPGQPLSIHWGFADPATVEGSADDKRAAFHTAFLQIKACVAELVNLPLENLDRDTLRLELQRIAAVAEGFRG
ncbi:MAG: arsenate reductase [Halothiobacillaceae bacterium]|nr:MAG: arsenate reductase [Halothiobacillaceae bacterium]